MPSKDTPKPPSKTASRSAIDPARLRAWCARRQQLGGAMTGRSAAEVIEKTGWLRSVGGASPYLALFDRAGLTREAVDLAVAKVEVHELPSARGCTYVVPARDYALALRAAQGHGDEAQVATAKKFLGVTDKELDKLAGRVTDVLAKGALDPSEIKEAVGDASRSLGAEGKKRGTSSTLPLALGRLQSHGEIRRVPVNGRLDQRRYRYVRWADGPLAKVTISDDELERALAEHFFRWAGFGSPAQLAWWAGLGVKAARARVAEMGVVPLSEGDERVIAPADRDELLAMAMPSEGPVSLVGSLDNALHLRRELSTVLDASDADVKVLGDKGSASVGSLADLPYHPIFERGRLVGLWDWDGVAGALVWRCFSAKPKATSDAATRLEDFVKRELGDVRSFSLDSPESRVDRIKALAKMK